MPPAIFSMAMVQRGIIMLPMPGMEGIDMPVFIIPGIIIPGIIMPGIMPMAPMPMFIAPPVIPRSVVIVLIAVSFDCPSRPDRPTREFFAIVASHAEPGRRLMGITVETCPTEREGFQLIVQRNWRANHDKNKS